MPQHGNRNTSIFRDCFGNCDRSCLCAGQAVPKDLASRKCCRIRDSYCLPRPESPPAKIVGHGLTYIHAGLFQECVGFFFGKISLGHEQTLGALDELSRFESFFERGVFRAQCAAVMKARNCELNRGSQFGGTQGLQQICHDAGFARSTLAAS